jgi:uncharacterized membrane protein YjgN (DUF898 family)
MSYAATGYGAAPASRGAEPVALTWSAQGGLIGLSLINFVLRVLTLGIHHFWGKTEVRRRIWSSVRLNGEPLQYTGTGMELFLGFLVVLAAVLLPLMLISVAAVLVLGQESPLLRAFYLLFYVVLFFLIGFAIHRAMRYRLARTRWRGIRGGLEGSALGYAWTYFWTALLIPLTLGWITPWRATILQSRIANGMRFGNRPFRFAARSGPLYGRFAVLWVGSLLLFFVLSAIVGYAMYLEFASNPQLTATPPGQSPQISAWVSGVVGVAVVAFYIVLGLMGAWYQAATINHFAAHTSYEGASFRGNATAWSLIWLVISNLLIVSLTLGLLAPVAQARSARYLVERMSIDGAVPLTEIAQRAEDPMKRGEGLAQAFDVDAF